MRPFIDLVDEGTHCDPTCQQHFGYVPTGPALLAAGRSRDENHLIHHGKSPLCSIGMGTVWYRDSRIFGYRLVPSEGKKMAARSTRKRNREASDETPIQQRIVSAAFAAFMAKGYAETSMLEIAMRARVSKRALYELVGNKQQILVACISERAQRLRVPPDLPEPRDRETPARARAAVGTQLLREISDPTVIAVFRLAIAEAAREPEG